MNRTRRTIRIAREATIMIDGGPDDLIIDEAIEIAETVDPEEWKTTLQVLSVRVLTDEEMKESGYDQIAEILDK